MNIVVFFLSSAIEHGLCLWESFQSLEGASAPSLFYPLEVFILNNKEYNNPTLVRRRFYLEPSTMAYLDKQAQELGISTSQYLDKLIAELKKEG